MIHACINRKILFYRAVPRPNFGGRCGRQQKLEMKINDVMFPPPSHNKHKRLQFDQIWSVRDFKASSAKQCRAMSGSGDDNEIMRAC